MKYPAWILVALMLLIAPLAEAQKKSTTTPQKKQSTTVKKVAPQKKSTAKPPAGKGPAGEKPKPVEEPVAGTIDPAKADTFRLQIIPLIRFFESSLNFLGDKRNDVSDMQTIITESYLKWCWNEKVQVEDDLDEERIVPLYKDMPAYLSDVDFFFKGARFQYTVQDIALETNAEGRSYFKVTANRNLRALTIGGDSINSNKVRYIEINYDSIRQQLKIVSVYTTKLNEKEDLRNWWNALSPDWKSILGDELKLEGTLPMSKIESFNDSLAIVGGKPTAIMGSEFYQFLNQIVNSASIDLSGRRNITDLSPINRLSGLKSVRISGTGVTDLMPLRNMNKLEELDLSHTGVATLEPLRYCVLLRQLKFRQTRVEDPDVISSFPGLVALDAGNTAINNLEAFRELTSLADLRINHTGIKDLSPVSGLIKLEMLNISSTAVSDLGPLRDMSELKVLLADSTMISSLDPIDSLSRLQKIYANHTRIDRKQALMFLMKHPSVSLVYASAALEQWWKNMGPEWQSMFSFFMTVNDPPTTEQLHRLILLDSVNITGRTSITSLEPLRQLILLRSLHMASSGITSLEPLSELTEIRVAVMNNTKVAGLAPLKNCSRLELLIIDNTQVSGLEPLYGMKGLKLVFADNSGVGDSQAEQFLLKNPGSLLIYQTIENTDWWAGLSPAWREVMQAQLSITGEPDKIQLQKMANLETVNINENFQITSLQPLTHLTRLTELQFSGTRVASLDPVSKMSRLRVLRLQKNPVTSLGPVSGLRALKELDFSNTQVEDLDALQEMVQLEILKFSGTQVKNLKYLQKLVNLRVIEFFNTRVTTIDVLDGMSKLETVKMFNTKVSSKRVDKLRAIHPRCEIVYY